MSEAIDGSWARFRKTISPVGGFHLDLSARQIKVLTEVHDQTVDYLDIHSINIVRELINIGLITSQRGRLHNLTDPGKRILGLVGTVNSQQERLLEAS